MFHWLVFVPSLAICFVSDEVEQAGLMQLQVNVDAAGQAVDAGDSLSDLDMEDEDADAPDVSFGEFGQAVDAGDSLSDLDMEDEDAPDTSSGEDVDPATQETDSEMHTDELWPDSAHVLEDKEVTIAGDEVEAEHPETEEHLTTGGDAHAALLAFNATARHTGRRKVGKGGIVQVPRRRRTMTSQKQRRRLTSQAPEGCVGGNHFCTTYRSTHPDRKTVLAETWRVRIVTKYRDRYGAAIKLTGTVNTIRIMLCVCGLCTTKRWTPLSSVTLNTPNEDVVFDEITCTDTKVATGRENAAATDLDAAFRTRIYMYTDGNDELFIDRLELRRDYHQHCKWGHGRASWSYRTLFDHPDWRSGVVVAECGTHSMLVRSWGAENAIGWCLSTDSNDMFYDTPVNKHYTKNKLVPSGCKRFLNFWKDGKVTTHR